MASLCSHAAKCQTGGQQLRAWLHWGSAAGTYGGSACPPQSSSDSNGCGSECPICAGTGSGHPGNGCSGCGADVVCSGGAQNGIWETRSSTQCHTGGPAAENMNVWIWDGSSGLDAAKQACLARPDCTAVYDPGCDQSGSSTAEAFYSCTDPDFASSQSSCVYVRPIGGGGSASGDGVVGTEVEYDGYRYRTIMDDIDPEATDTVCHGASDWLPMPAGYELAPDTTAVKQNVVAAHPWHTHLLVLDSLRAYGTAQFSPGELFGDSQDKAVSRTQNGEEQWSCPWTCYQILVRAPVGPPPPPQSCRATATFASPDTGSTSSVRFWYWDDDPPPNLVCKYEQHLGSQYHTSCSSYSHDMSSAPTVRSGWSHCPNWSHGNTDYTVAMCDGDRLVAWFVEPGSLSHPTSNSDPGSTCTGGHVV